jgi:hypothetical protein
VLLRNFGLDVGKVTGRDFEPRVRELASENRHCCSWSSRCSQSVTCYAANSASWTIFWSAWLVTMLFAAG